MKATITLFLVCLTAISCRNSMTTGKFELSGNIRNISDQKIYLEQLYFSQHNPEVLDTAEIKNGKFKLTAVAPEQGLYRLRMEKATTAFIFINDKSEINFTADVKDSSLAGPKFSTAANDLLKRFLLTLNLKGEALNKLQENLQTLQAGDTQYSTAIATRDALSNDYKTFITRFIDTTSNPVVAMFALGYTRGIDPAELEKIIPNLSKRFPKHSGVASIVGEYNSYMTKLKEPKPVKSGRPGPGDLAPDFTMDDSDGKPFSLSMLKGKYVLVDFWASWCGPCRGENPAVVAAYNKYMDKNFTILGVSLDEDKSKWLQAIKKDNLTWKQVSDLKQWNSIAVPLYGFDGIPYNVLLDPQGKIIATELRGSALDDKLAEVLQ